jgi:hypothetical protein
MGNLLDVNFYYFGNEAMPHLILIQEACHGEKLLKNQIIQ